MFGFCEEYANLPRMPNFDFRCCSRFLFDVTGTEWEINIIWLVVELWSHDVVMCHSVVWINSCACKIWIWIDSNSCRITGRFVSLKWMKNEISEYGINLLLLGKWWCSGSRMGTNPISCQWIPDYRPYHWKILQFLHQLPNPPPLHATLTIRAAGASGNSARLQDPNPGPRSLQYRSYHYAATYLVIDRFSNIYTILANFIFRPF